MDTSEINNLTARLAIADAVLNAVKESGLLRAKARRARAGSAVGSPAAKAAAAERMRAYRAKKATQGKKAPRKAPKKTAARPANPLANVPADEAAAG